MLEVVVGVIYQSAVHYIGYTVCNRCFDVGQRIEGDANDKLFFRPLKNRPRSLGANGRLTAIIRHIIGEY